MLSFSAPKTKVLFLSQRLPHICKRSRSLSFCWLFRVWAWSRPQLLEPGSDEGVLMIRRTPICSARSWAQTIMGVPGTMLPALRPNITHVSSNTVQGMEICGRHVWRSFPWQVTPSCALRASMIHSLRSDLLHPVRNAGTQQSGETPTCLSVGFRKCSLWRRQTLNKCPSA